MEDFWNTIKKDVWDKNWHSLNKQEDKMSIPLGRHSFMNGKKLTVPYSDEGARQFTNEVGYFFRKIELIRDWQKLCLFHNLHDLGFRITDDIAIHKYDSMLPDLKNDKGEIFQLMVSFLTDGMRENYLKTSGRCFSSSDLRPDI